MTTEITHPPADTAPSIGLQVTSCKLHCSNE